MCVDAAESPAGLGIYTRRSQQEPGAEPPRMPTSLASPAAREQSSSRLVAEQTDSRQLRGQLAGELLPAGARPDAPEAVQPLLHRLLVSVQTRQCDVHMHAIRLKDAEQVQGSRTRRREAEAHDRAQRPRVI